MILFSKIALDTWGGYGIYYFTRPLERFSSAQEEGIFGTSKITYSASMKWSECDTQIYNAIRNFREVNKFVALSCQVQRFFRCIRAVMSINLRSMAVNSLEDFVKFMKTYASGNDFGSSSGKDYQEGQYLQPPMLRIR